MHNSKRDMKRMQTGRFLILLLVSVLCGLMAFALPQATQNPQNQRNQTPVFKIESDLVVVDVSADAE